MTETFDPGDSRHRAVKDELMLGIALNGIATFAEVDGALESVGFEVVEASDLGAGAGTPWYRPLEGRSGALRDVFPRSPLGRKAMIGGLRLAEALRIFPKGTSTVAGQIMDRTAYAYVAGGKAGIFTPLYCFLARKPAVKDPAA